MEHRVTENLTGVGGTGGEESPSLYKATIEQRFPKEDYPDAPLPEHLPMFAFPAGLQLTPQEQRPTFFCFTLTELSGDRFYGACLHSYEKLNPALLRDRTVEEASTLGEDDELSTGAPVATDDDESDSVHGQDLRTDDDSLSFLTSRMDVLSAERIATAPGSSESSQLYVPRSLCLLSRFPYFSVFRECLRELFLAYRTQTNLPIECYIAYLTRVLPVPPPAASVQFQLLYKKVLYHRPSDQFFPVSDYAISCLFHTLGIKKTLQVYAGVLAEHKTVFCSRHYSLMTVAAEAITQLMTPFRWHHIYIPILPRELLAFMEAPTPFIVGVHAEYRHLMDDFNDVNVVDLDSGELRMYGQVVPLPSQAQTLLEDRLQRILYPQLMDMDLAFPAPPPMQATGMCCSPSAMQPLQGDLLQNTQIKLAFLHLWIDLFKNYTNYISFIRKFPEPVTIFNKAKFIKDCPGAVDFLSIFLGTQAFSMFLELHHQDGSTIFDCIIHAQQRGLSWSQMLQDSEIDVLDQRRKTIVVDSTSSMFSSFAQTVNVTREGDGYSQYPKIRDECVPPHVNPAPASPPPNTGDIQSNTIKEEFVPLSAAVKETVKELDCIPNADGSFIEECMDRVLSGKPLSRDRADFLENLLKLEPSRLLFVQALKSRSNSICELKSVFFEQLIKLCRCFLSEANNNNDFSSPTVFIFLMGNFKAEGENDDYLYNHTKDLAIWQNKYFWEAAFFEAVASERQMLPDEYKVGHAMTSAWEQLSEDEQKELQTKEANLLFGVLGSFAYHMLKTGISASEASSFLLQMCRLCDVDNDQTNELQTLVENMAHINDCLDPITNYTKEQRRTMEEAEGSFKLEYFASSKRMDQDSATLYRQLIEQKDEKKHFDFAEEEKDGYAIRTLYGHKKSISSMALFYPKLVTGSVDGEIRLWDLETQSYSPFRFQSHSDRITSIIINQDIMISASQDTRIVVWQQKTGKITHDFCSHTGTVNSIHLKNGMLLSGADDHLVKVWDLSDGSAREMEGHKDAVLCVRWIDNERFASCSKDKTICIWDAENYTLLRQLEGHSDWVKTISIDLQQNIILSASYDCSLRVWNLKNGDCVQVLLGHVGRVNCFDYHKRVVASGSSDHTVRLWDMDTGVELFNLQREDGDEVAAVHLSPISDHLVTAGLDSTISIWNYKTGKLIDTLTGHTDWIRSLMLVEHPIPAPMASSSKKDDKEIPFTIISSSWDSTVKIWDRHSGALPKKKGKKFSKIFGSKSKSMKGKGNK